jgi:hypothetical protein
MVLLPRGLFAVLKKENLERHETHETGFFSSCVSFPFVPFVFRFCVALEGMYTALEYDGEAPTLPFRLHCMKTGRVAQIAIGARLQILA